MISIDEILESYKFSPSLTWTSFAVMSGDLTGLYGEFLESPTLGFYSSYRVDEVNTFIFEHVRDYLGELLDGTEPDLMLIHQSPYDNTYWTTYLPDLIKLVEDRRSTHLR